MPDFKRYKSAIAVNTTFIGDLGLQQSPRQSTMSDKCKTEAGRYLKRCITNCSHYNLLLRDGKAMDIEVKGKVIKIIDSTTISLCLSLFEWAKVPDS